MYTYYIELLLITYKTDAQISKNSKYKPYFRDILSTLNRTFRDYLGT